MDEIIAFATVLLVVGAGISLGIFSAKLSERFPVPAPAIFLLLAAIASDVFPELAEHVSIREVERIGVVALIVILFDGGMTVGWRRFRTSLYPISALGIVGTFGTAAVTAAIAHYVFGFEWTTAGLIGAALAPTDPAVMFSVLGNREVAGRSGTILAGESGANDPVGIALMLALIELAETDGGSFGAVVGEFALALGVGLVVGLAGAAALLPMMRRVALPDAGLYPIRALAAAFVIYGVASVLHGSGFLAVFVAGIVIGDERAPYKREVERFHTSLASLAEIAVFVALGLTTDITDLWSGDTLGPAIGLAVLLALVARPLVAIPLLLPTRLRWGERLFVAWGGLKGAVPILLATFALLAEVDDAQRVYDIVFVVVTFSVVVQGSSMVAAARRLRIPMRRVRRDPWDITIGLPQEPGALHRYVVARGSHADGQLIRELPLSENAWIILLVRDGDAVRAGGSTELIFGDEVFLLTDQETAPGLRRLFQG